MISLIKHFLSVFTATACLSFVALFVASRFLTPDAHPLTREVLAETLSPLPASTSEDTTISYAYHPGLTFIAEAPTLNDTDLLSLVSITVSPTPTDSLSLTATPTQPSSTPTVPEVVKAEPTAIQASPTPTIPEPTITLLPSPTPTISGPTPAPVTGADIDGFFSKYSSYYSVDQEKLKRIARCESGMNPNARNLQYAGLFQFGPGTWESVRQKMSGDPNVDLRVNPEEAIKTAAFYLSISGERAWPHCQ